MRKNKPWPSYPPLFVVKTTECFRKFLLRLYWRFTHPNMAVFEMVQHFWLAVALGVAAELNVAEWLKKGPKSIKELAGLTHTHEESLYRLMRVLSSHGIFRQIRNGDFALTALAGALHEDQARYLVSAHLTKLHFYMFSELLYCVQTGQNTSELFTNKPLFKHLGQQEKSGDLFNQAMHNATMMQIPALLPAFSFRKYEKVVDVGGGQGLLLAAILSQSKACTGILYDLPQATKNAKDVFIAFDILERVTVINGDFFNEIPRGGDLYLLKSVLHDWNDEEALKILKNLHKAMSVHGRLLIIESILDTGNHPSFGKMNDMLMMVATSGKERTKEEYKDLLAKAGFCIKKIHPTLSPHSMIESVKENKKRNY